MPGSALAFLGASDYHVRIDLGAIASKRILMAGARRGAGCQEGLGILRGSALRSIS